MKWTSVLIHCEECRGRWWVPSPRRRSRFIVTHRKDGTGHDVESEP